MVPLNQAVRKLLAFGSGAGIVIGSDDLELFAVRVRPAGPHFLACETLSGFRRRPAAEWGAEWTSFLAKAGLRHTSALVVLPREDVILRTLALPGVDEEDVPAAISFQLDSLHPYPEDEVYFDWQRISPAGDFAIAIVTKAKVDEYAALLEEAGILASGFTVSGSSLYRAIRLYGSPPEGFLTAVGPHEIYGESASKRLLSVSSDQPGPSSVAGALAELRLAPELEPVPPAQVLPLLRGTSEDFDPSPWTLAYAASLVSAVPHLGAPLNLLPVARRTAHSRGRYIPTAVLAGLVAITGLILLFQGAWYDRQYLALVQGEITRLDPVARKVEALDRQTSETAARARELDQFRLRTKADLDLLLELTRQLKPPAYLTGIEISRTSVGIAGEAEQAEGLLKILDSSPLIAASEFSMPITRSGNSETFRIRMAREAAK
jgi:hypothetical protein